MKILSFTDSPDVRKILEKNRLHPFALQELKPKTECLREPCLCYVDAGSWQGSPDHLLAVTGKNKFVFLGIIDSTGKIKNPVALMHKGLVDYIGPKEINTELSRVHCTKVIFYLKKYRKDFTSCLLSLNHNGAENVSRHTSCALGWKDIKPGKRYAFAIMYIEMDEREEMENRYGSANLQNALLVFRRYIEKNASMWGGRVWMWSRYGGILLFPLRGNESAAVLCGFRIVMYKFLHDVEESLFPNFISFRIAVHMGDLIYREQNKGEVVSDSLNTVFHLGQEFAEPGCYYVTDDLFHYVPEPIRPYFKNAGSFEGRLIHRMRLPVL